MTILSEDLCFRVCVSLCIYNVCMYVRVRSIHRMRDDDDWKYLKMVGVAENIEASSGVPVVKVLNRHPVLRIELVHQGPQGLRAVAPPREEQPSTRRLLGC